MNLNPPVPRGAVPAALAAVLFWVGVASPALAQPAAGPTLEGVWKITGPQSSLKPLSGAIPFTREGRKQYEANKRLSARGAYDDFDISRSRCSSLGTPRLMLTSERFKIWQRQGVVTFAFEWNRAIRQIDVRGVPTEPLLVPTMTGDAKGHWEGDTLVAVTTDISDRTLIDDLVPHTDALKVTERFRIVDADTLQDRITIDDAAYFTHPWDAVVTYKRQPAVLFQEDVCLDRLGARQPTPPSP